MRHSVGVRELPGLTMARKPSRYAIHLILSGGHRESVHFKSLEAFQNWYAGVLNAASTPEAFVNVPINQLEGEYLLLRAGSIIGLRIEPIFAAYDD